MAAGELCAVLLHSADVSDVRWAPQVGGWVGEGEWESHCHPAPPHSPPAHPPPAGLPAGHCHLGQQALHVVTGWGISGAHSSEGLPGRGGGYWEEGAWGHQWCIGDSFCVSSLRLSFLSSLGGISRRRRTAGLLSPYLQCRHIMSLLLLLSLTDSIPRPSQAQGITWAPRGGSFLLASRDCFCCAYLAAAASGAQ